jgi:menaquinol-cytochrome c reductase iron-sulfur subunit
MTPETSNAARQEPRPPVRDRRAFFQRLARWVTVGVGSLAAVVLAVPLAGFFLGALRKRAPVKWVSLGPIASFPPNETRLVSFDSPLRQSWDGMTARTGVFVRYQGRDGEQTDQFLVFAANCAHLGCGVTWFPESGLFMCPCHGGVYYANGERASGPPPRGLFHCVWRVRDGVLEVQAPHYPTLQNPPDRRVSLPVAERRA